MRSLRQRVVIWFIPPLFLLMVVNAVLSYRGALAVVNRAYDRSLQASMKAIAEGTHSLNGEIVVNIPYSALELFEDGTHEHVFYAVLGPDGKTITGYNDLPPPELGPNEHTVVTEGRYKGERIRIGAMRKRLYDAALGGNDAVTILMAETTESRATLARELFYDSLRRQALLIGAGLVVLALALTTAFRPLLHLREAIRNRSEEDLTPIPRHRVPAEITPLIDAMNNQMDRLSRMVEARKRFLTDAAHQLRTPLAVLNTQVDYGMRQTEPAEMQSTFVGLRDGLRSARHLTDQMLALSRAEAAHGLGQTTQSLDLAALAREVALELSPLALERQIDLGYEGEFEAALMMGNASMLREMIANLVDNSIRYTPSGGSVTVTVVQKEDSVKLSVTDTGPGIPAGERANVVKRFYRILGRGNSGGSGLGLSIVNEICLSHGGRLELADGPAGKGLQAKVVLPRFRA